MTLFTGEEPDACTQPTVWGFFFSLYSNILSPGPNLPEILHLKKRRMIHPNAGSPLLQLGTASATALVCGSDVCRPAAPDGCGTHVSSQLMYGRGGGVSDTAG